VSVGYKDLNCLNVVHIKARSASSAIIAINFQAVQSNDSFFFMSGTTTPPTIIICFGLLVIRWHFSG
jgi:hypothetical protein